MIAITLFLVCLIASLLTFFSGFGLGTILLPTFSIFFPVEAAVLFTAIVHFFNNIFKISTLHKHVKRQVLLTFGIPALLGAFLGAQILLYLLETSINEFIFSYHILNHNFSVTSINLIIGILILIFGLKELLNFNFFNSSRYPLSIGGFFSGLFGGISGHQGALRSAFLIHFKLSKEAFIASGVAIALIVDATRMTVYLQANTLNSSTELPLFEISSALIGAMLGVLMGRFFLEKITIEWVSKIVHVFLIVMGLALIMGVL